MKVSRECHNTGTNALRGRTNKPPVLCRGARDIQLKVMAATRAISKPTDAAWNRQREAIGMKPTIVKDP